MLLSNITYIVKKLIPPRDVSIVITILDLDLAELVDWHLCSKKPGHSDDYVNMIEVIIGEYAASGYMDMNVVAEADACRRQLHGFRVEIDQWLLTAFPYGINNLILKYSVVRIEEIGCPDYFKINLTLDKETHEHFQNTASRTGKRVLMGRVR